MHGILNAMDGSAPSAEPVDIRTEKCPQCGAKLAPMAAVCPRCRCRNPSRLTRRQVANRAILPYPGVAAPKAARGFYWPMRYIASWTWLMGMRAVFLILGIAMIVLLRQVPIPPAARLVIFIALPVTLVVLAFGGPVWQKRRRKAAWAAAIATNAQCPACGQTIPQRRATCPNCGTQRAF
jgi:ribosomal protein L32